MPCCGKKHVRLRECPALTKLDYLPFPPQALVAGNSLKAGVRFFSYDKFKKMLVDRDVSYLAGKGTFPKDDLVD